MDGRVRVNDNMEISYRRTHTEENKHIRTYTQIQSPSIASHVHFAAALPTRLHVLPAAQLSANMPLPLAILLFPFLIPSLVLSLP